MRLRSIIRTISVSLTTAIIVSCNINGEPEGRQVTDYQEYEVTVASENVPDNFIPEWFFEQHCADLDDFAYKVEAEDPAAVEDDIESDPAFSFNGGRCCIAGLGKWFLLDRDGNVGKWGQLKRVSMSADEMPGIYRIFPPEDAGSIRGYGRLEFMELGDDDNSLMQFDIFFAPLASSKADQPISHSFRLWLYKDLTEEYQKK